MALHKNVKLELIKRIPLFAQCSKAELARVAAIADEVHMPEGKALTREGEPGLEFFVLVDGTVAVQQGERKINELSDGDFFGEVSVIAGTPRTATVTTTAPSRLLVVTDRELT
jgi:cAMP-binding proteins - catabolite gene activator and regulatory subunit of cAMP-dependent protein kinases